LYVNSGRWVYHEIQQQGIAETLESAGVRIVTDTCTLATREFGLIFIGAGFRRMSLEYHTTHADRPLTVPRGL
jgi:hypothetical protein